MLPIRHCDGSIDRDHAEWGAAFRQAAGLLGTGSIVALLGTRGTGKTRLAVALARRAIHLEGAKPDGSIGRYGQPEPDGGWRNERPVLYTKAMQMFMSIRSAYGWRAEESELDIASSYAQPNLLIIDEIQERGNSEWEDRVLVNIIDQRYDAVKDTVLVGNLTPESLSESLGPSIVSRIRETGVVIPCNWTGFRP